ncbi:MAG: peptidoglycan-binding protein [Clostridia bacterium]|nr:peptidoglycan-binding protein [Clostridia bacterium]
MQRKNLKAAVTFVTALAVIAVLNSPNVYASAKNVLKQGSKGSAVSALQRDLKTVGALSIKPTGYYGNVTTSAVKRFQKHYKLKADGIAGKSTMTKLDKLLGRNLKPVSITRTSYTLNQVKTPVISKANTTLKLVSRSGEQRTSSALIPWFGGVENIFQRGQEATIFDIETGLSFNAKRTYGTNHADCETLTPADTEIMKKIYSGSWSWSRRPVIVTFDGKSIAGSMAGMPHAGIDTLPGGAYVSWRSLGYGPGINLDDIKGNDMDGHFDIHFLGSKTHGTNRVDQAHQSAVKEAAQWAEMNLK